MTVTISIQEWLRPPMGSVDARIWEVASKTSETAMLDLALVCARRGDCESLTRLCEQLMKQPAGKLLSEGQGVDVNSPHPDLDGVHLAAWDDPKRQSETMPVSLMAWNDVRLEDLIGMCLARPRLNGAPVQPRREVDDWANRHPGHVTPFKPRLDPAEVGLVDAAMALFQELPASQYRPEGIVRLFGALTGQVGAPEIVGRFLSAGFSADRLTGSEATLTCGKVLDGKSMSAAAQAMKLGNPVMALELLNLPMPPEVKNKLRTELFEAMAQKPNKTRNEGLNLPMLVESLRASLGEEAFHCDDRFIAAMAVCDQVSTCQYAPNTIKRALRLVAEHLDCVANLRDSKKSWSESVVHGLLQPVTEMADFEVQEGFGDVFHTTPDLARNLVRGALRASCWPVLQAMGPALNRIMSPEFWGDDEYGGWSQLAAQAVWRDNSTVRWKKTLEVLAASGQDPTVRLFQDEDEAPSAGEAIGLMVKHTTLMHLVARKSQDDGTIDRMFALLEMGADPKAHDHVVKTPARCMSSKEDSASWVQMCRSHEAKLAAESALLEISVDELSLTEFLSDAKIIDAQPIRREGP